MSKANPQLRALFLIMGATVLSTTALQFYLATNIIDNEAELVRQSFDIRHVDLFLSALKDAETGQRGYLLTGNDRYLEPFQKAKVEIKKEINELEIRARATGGELFANFLVKARGFSELKMTELQHTIDVQKSRGLKPALSIVASGPGQEFMDQLRALVDGFKAKKSAEINVSTHRRDRLIRLRNAVWLLFFLLNAGILAWSFWRLKLSINKRLRNEQILHEQAALLSLAHDAIIVRSAQDKVIFWNSGAKEVYGWTAEEALGRVTHELFKTRFPKPLPEIMDDVAKQKRWDGELIHARKDGKEIVVASRWAAEPDASGKLLRMLEINRDITQSKRSEKELLAAREDAQRATLVAEEASQSKSIFLANMSHEIRTPLGAVLGFSELLANEKLAASDRAKFATIVKRNGKLLSNIISDVLDLSKIEAGECEIEKQDVAIQEVLSDVTTVMSLRAMDKGLKLTVSASGAIPTRIRTDLLRLRQVLINIVGNAIKFTT
jgi:PAS domain S-box-containing protein